jgi:hypothetical protein
MTGYDRMKEQLLYEEGSDADDNPYKDNAYF